MFLVVSKLLRRSGDDQNHISACFHRSTPPTPQSIALLCCTNARHAHAALLKRSMQFPRAHRAPFARAAPMSQHFAPPSLRAALRSSRRAWLRRRALTCRNAQHPCATRRNSTARVSNMRPARRPPAGARSRPCAHAARSARPSPLPTVADAQKRRQGAALLRSRPSTRTCFSTLVHRLVRR